MSSLIAQYAEPVKAVPSIELTDAEITAVLARAASIRKDIENDLDVTALESLYDQFSATLTACGTMRNIQSAIQFSAESGGGLSPSALKMMQIAAESEMSRVSLLNQSLFPADSYFTNSSTRLAATTIAAESLGETIKGMLNKLVEFITKIWSHIKAFLKRIFNRRGEVTAKMKALQNDIEHMVEDVGAPKYVDEKSHAHESDEYRDDADGQRKFHFGIKDKCNGDTSKIIVHNHLTLITMNREIILHIVDALKHVVNIGEKKKLLDWEIEHLVHNIKDRFDKFTLMQKKLLDGKTIYSYGYFYNDQVCLLREQVGRQEDDTHVKLFNLEIHIGKLPGQPYRPETLSRKDMAELATGSIELMDKAAGLEKVIPIVEKVLHGTTDQLHGKFNTADTNEERESVVAAINVIHDLFKYVTATLPKLVSDATTASDNLSGYIRASIKLHHA
jgi:hypothetical protein